MRPVPDVTALLYAGRYFRAVPPIPALLTTSFVVLTVIGGVATVSTHDKRAAALVPVVVLQAFSSATGFAAPARRGYFDLLIARGIPRVHIALVQWLTAIAPGLLSWATLAAVAALVDPVTYRPLVTSGTATAFMLASTIPWAVTVSLPRFSGAIGWLLLVCLGDVGGAVWPDWVRGVVYPLDLVGRDVRGHLELLILAVLLSTVSIAIALSWVHRSDIPLEAAQ